MLWITGPRLVASLFYLELDYLTRRHVFSCVAHHAFRTYVFLEKWEENVCIYVSVFLSEEHSFVSAAQFNLRLQSSRNTLPVFKIHCDFEPAKMIRDKKGDQHHDHTIAASLIHRRRPSTSPRSPQHVSVLWLGFMEDVLKGFMFYIPGLALSALLRGPGIAMAV